ncbi:MAG: hypothetical protein KDA88_05725 [Planctomycetaceae bacterium]|nr:hypothetical protein [Planctomycetaceae bacterium]MCB9952870.1 hypothetical protein [Planctomycetaceae bacterium]
MAKRRRLSKKKQKSTFQPVLKWAGFAVAAVAIVCGAFWGIPKIIGLVSTIEVPKFDAKTSDAKFDVGPDTTKITGPLRAGTKIDYLAAMNEKYGAGVTSETNRAVSFMRIAGTGIKEDAAHKELLNLLGDGSIVRQPQKPLNLKERGDNALLRELNAASVKPWDRTSRQRLAEWLDEVDADLDSLAESLRQPHFHIPLVAQSMSRTGPIVCPVTSAVFPSPASNLTLAKVFSVRAMYRAGNGNSAGAVDDVVTQLTFARLMQKQPATIERFVGISSEFLAAYCAQGLVNSGVLDAGETQRLIAGIEQLPLPIPFADQIDEYTRYMVLDIVQETASEGFTALGLAMQGNGIQPSAQLAGLEQRSYDWNEALRTVNSNFDIAVEGCRQANYGEAKRRLSEYDRDLRERISADMTGPSSADAKKNGRLIGNLITTMFKDPEAVSLGGDVRNQVLIDLTLAGARLSLRRLQGEELPDSLDGFREVILLNEDPFTQEPLQYERRGGWLLVYSVGPNETRDGAPRKVDDVGLVFKLLENPIAPSPLEVD